MDADTIVIGAGVVGLAIARQLAAAGRDVIVLEREAAVGTATSSRNSGVIHAGIYYPTGSLKAQLCVRGKALLYEFCAARGVAHRRCGKLIVAASDAEVGALDGYVRSAAANGAGELLWLDRAAAFALEPAVECVAALHSTTTGIIDVHELMQAYQADIESANGQVVLESPVARVEAGRNGFVVELGDAERTRIRSRELVNAAGLHAPAVAARIEGLSADHVPVAHYARGHYFSLAGAPPFRRLVYPIAGSAGLGVHATLDLAGRIRFGPDVEWIQGVDYAFGADRIDEFAAAIRRYFPSLDATRLAPDYTGIRPKIGGPDDKAQDFRMDGPERHGLAGLVNLFGIESPGLTASLAIAEHVAGLIEP